MARSSYLKFNCPSCGTKFAGIEPLNSATQVVRRTCKKCHETWQLIVRCIKATEGVWLDMASFTFLGRTR